MCLCQDREWSDREWFAYYEKKVKMAKGKESQLDLNDSHVSMMHAVYGGMHAVHGGMMHAACGGMHGMVSH